MPLLPDESRASEALRIALAFHIERCALDKAGRRPDRSGPGTWMLGTSTTRDGGACITLAYRIVSVAEPGGAVPHASRRPDPLMVWGDEPWTLWGGAAILAEAGLTCAESAILSYRDSVPEARPADPPLDVYEDIAYIAVASNSPPPAPLVESPVRGAG